MLLHTVRWLWSEDQRMLFTVVMIRLRFNTFRAAEIYEAFANESMPCDEPWPKKGAWRSSSD